jgi:hypothetical protein
MAKKKFPEHSLVPQYLNSLIPLSCFVHRLWDYSFWGSGTDTIEVRQSK